MEDYNVQKLSFVILYISLKSNSCYFKNSVTFQQFSLIYNLVAWVNVSFNTRSDTFDMAKATRNSTALIAFTSTISPKQDVLLDLAVFTNHLSWSFSVSRNILNKISLATFWKYAESKIALPSISYTRLDIFILESIINIWCQESTLNKERCTWSESATVLISFLKQKLIQSWAKYLIELHLKQCIILPCLSIRFVLFPQYTFCSMLLWYWLKFTVQLPL